MPPTSTASLRTVLCVSCRGLFRVPEKATILTCPNCHRRVRVDDVVVDEEQHTRRLETCGRIIVRRRGRVFADVVCAALGIDVLGELHAQSVTTSRAYIGPRAVWTGDCVASAIVIETGAQIRGGKFRIVKPVASAEAALSRAAAARSPCAGVNVAEARPVEPWEALASLGMDDAAAPAEPPSENPTATAMSGTAGAPRRVIQRVAPAPVVAPVVAPPAGPLRPAKPVLRAVPRPAPTDLEDVFSRHLRRPAGGAPSPADTRSEVDHA